MYGVELASQEELSANADNGGTKAQDTLGWRRKVFFF
jgi:hypothetical protein